MIQFPALLVGYGVIRTVQPFWTPFPNCKTEVILLFYFLTVLCRLETLWGWYHNKVSFFMFPYSMSREGGAQVGHSCIQVIPMHHLHTKFPV